MRSYITKLLRFFDRSGKIRLGGLFILICIITCLEMFGLSLVFPLMEGLKNPEAIIQLPGLSFIYHNYFLNEPKYFLLVLSIVCAVTYIFKNLIMLMMIYLQTRFVQNCTARMAHLLFKGYLGLPYTYHMQRNTAELLRNLENSVIVVFNKGLISILYLLMDGMIMIGLLSVLFIIDFWSTLLVILMLTICFSVFYFVVQKRLHVWSTTEHSLIAEIYKLINKSGEENSIHLKNFVEIPENWKDEELNTKWDKIKKIRDEANISIEAQRAEKIIGSSLEAKIQIKIKEEIYNVAKNEDFAEICITSSASILKDDNIKNDIQVNTQKAVGKKCPVCWKISENGCKKHDHLKL